MKLAILGGGGCFGLNLARHALTLGHAVVGIGRSPLRGEPFTLGAVEMGYRYFNYSIGPDTDFIIELLDEEKPELIVCFAAQGEGAASFKASHWKYFYRTNTVSLVEFTEHLSSRKWLSRFIQVGTSELYGSVDVPSKEADTLIPTSPYACSKAAFDMHLLSIAKVLKFPGLIIRPSNCFTPGQQLHRVIPKAFLYGLMNKKLELHGGGKSRKSYLDADDLSRAILLIADKGAVGEVYNCGPEEPIAIRSLLELCAKCMGVRFSDLVEEAPDRTGQDGCYWLDSSKLRALAWRPEVTLAEGVAKMHGWVSKYAKQLTSMPTAFRMRS